jgi:hypothetical protein
MNITPHYHIRLDFFLSNYFLQEIKLCMHYLIDDLICIKEVTNIISDTLDGFHLFIYQQNQFAHIEKTDWGFDVFHIFIFF